MPRIAIINGAVTGEGCLNPRDLTNSGLGQAVNTLYASFVACRIFTQENSMSAEYISGVVPILDSQCNRSKRVEMRLPMPSLDIQYKVSKDVDGEN